MKEQLKTIAESRAFTLKEVNILNDHDAYGEFKDEIPVLFINGRKAFKYRLNEQEFLERLARAESVVDSPRSGRDSPGGVPRV